MSKSSARTPRAVLATLAAAALILGIACTQEGSGQSGTPTPIAFEQRAVDRSRIATAEVVRDTGEQTPSGLRIEDGCVVGQLPPPPSRGQIFGNGVNIVVDVNSTENFSRAVADTSLVACRGAPQRDTVEQLVARINGIPGTRVVDYTYPGR